VPHAVHARLADSDPMPFERRHLLPKPAKTPAMVSVTDRSSMAMVLTLAGTR
jgi:hypothetical protein